MPIQAIFDHNWTDKLLKDNGLTTVMSQPALSQSGLAGSGPGRYGIEDILGAEREKILEIAQKHGASNVRVFGSVARGEASSSSDVDFLVDYDLEKITPWFPAGLLLELEQLLERKVDIATVDMLKERIKAEVLLEAVEL